MLNTGIGSRVLSRSQIIMNYGSYNEKLILNELLIQLMRTRVLLPLTTLNGL